MVVRSVPGGTRRDTRWSAAAIAVALALARAAGADAGAAVEGTVALPPPPAAPAPKPRYPGAPAEAVGDPEPPAAVVYLEGDFPPSVADGPPAELAQHRYQFVPGLLPVRRGTTVVFPNLDDEYHSVFSYSQAKRFDLGRFHKDEKPAALVFDRTGVVKLFCEIHDHMRGTILVLDTPYFQKTDAAGRYRLEGLPAGDWTLKAWLAEGVVRERAVALRDGETRRADFPPE
jgi:plastocyanin